MNFQFVGSGRPVSEFAQAAYAEAIQAELANAMGGSENVFAAFPQMRGGGGDESWSEEKGAPPIAKRCLSELPMVRISEEDLVQDGNDFCCVCLDPQRVGDVALKLPCGHLYHRECAVDWLQKHCTCPNCRYELESDEPAFERGRSKRMRERRPRYRRRDLERRSARDLRALLRDHGLSLAGLCEKRELIDALVASGSVQIIPEPVLELACDANALATLWTTKQLKELMLHAGVDSSRCVEKDELVKAILASARVAPAPTHADDDQRSAASAAALAKIRLEDLRRRADLMMDYEPPTKKKLSRADIDAMSVASLKAELAKRGLEHELRGCPDKDHMRRVLARCVNGSSPATDSEQLHSD
ncbi:hypothetical protein CTAYLR_007982 [Chrysophaeum taylorii]|uniref:RING-type domain-containing protein n=1 Tax=Chrysophaeum taylorii TaxID=2483200 RepID=A0AAD7XII2_9STRA|nr:hypothetical protein CTAYLR_007982 [Chrysophaeum taylorii]